MTRHFALLPLELRTSMTLAAAIALYDDSWLGGRSPWDHASKSTQDSFLRQARAALIAARSAELQYESANRYVSPNGNPCAEISLGEPQLSTLREDGMEEMVKKLQARM